MAESERENWADEVPDLAEAVEELQGVDALLVGEVDDAVEAVVLHDLQSGIHLVRAVVDGGVGVAGGGELVAAADVAVHDGGAAQRVGGLRGGLAGLDDDPEHGRAREAQRLAHPAEVVGLRRPGARGRDHDEQLVAVVLAAAAEAESRSLLLLVKSWLLL